MHMRTQRTLEILFYVDIVLMGLGAIAVVLLVHDAFTAGFTLHREPGSYMGYVYRMAAEVVFLVLTLSYFLARFYKARVRELANPWG